MNAETLKAAAELWKPLLVLGFIAFTVLFKEQLKKLFTNLPGFRFKGLGTEVSVEPHKEQELQPETHQKEQAPTNPVTAEVTPQVLEREPTTASEWEKMFDAFLTRRPEQAEAAFTRMQESEPNGVQKLKNEADYLWMRYTFADDPTALPKLLHLVEREEVSAHAKHWVGRCYETAGDFERAATAYDDSARFEQGEKQRMTNIVALSRCLYKAGKKEAAFQRLMDELSAATSADAVAALYNGLAALYEKDQEPELRALALEKALEVAPSDTDLLFSMAYSYSQKGIDALALLHYKTLLRFNPEYPAALNNIAVAYGRLKLSVLEVKFYKRAAIKNNTLAMANLANQYMNAGFADEAKDILDKARQQQDIHPNVGGAISAFFQKQETETKTEEGILKLARDQQRCLRAFAEAYFVKTPHPLGFSGVWQHPSGIEVMITQTDDQLEASGARDNDAYKFTGRASNRAAKIEIERKTEPRSLAALALFRPPVPSLPDIKYSHGPGYAYLSSDARELFIMSLEQQDTPLFETLTRISE